MPVQLLTVRELPSHTYHIVRQQHHSAQLLEYLLEDLPPGLFKILGITGVDLYIPILTHVFGEAQVGGTGAIISAYRLRQEENGVLVPPHLLLPRLIKAGMHELGHTFNLKHCRQPGCVMQFSPNLEKLDQKEAAYCDYCGVLLADYFNNYQSPRLSGSGEIPAPVAPSRAEDSVRKHRRRWFRRRGE